MNGNGQLNSMLVRLLEIATNAVTPVDLNEVVLENFLLMINIYSIYII